MPYITGASTISHQHTFGNPGFSETVKPLQRHTEPVFPDFRDYIDGSLLRRMGKILRMSVAGAKACLSDAGVDQPGAIVVGTGLGCLQDTEKFLDHALTVEGLIPPTAFIQSTHNTMAGQISLSLKNHGYNMTHTQNTISFEHALIDGMVLLSEELENVLVGAADEKTEMLEKISENLGLGELELTSGASFFIMTNNPAGAMARLVDSEVVSYGNAETQLARFLKRNGWGEGQVDLVLFARETDQVFRQADTGIKLSYSPMSGFYPTSAAFAFHFALDFIQLRRGEFKRVLIFNNLGGYNLGLTLLESVET